MVRALGLLVTARASASLYINGVCNSCAVTSDERTRFRFSDLRANRPETLVLPHVLACRGSRTFAQVGARVGLENR
jgi:hypothetical protein